MAGKVSLRSGSVTTLTLSPNCSFIIFSCVALVATVNESARPVSRICLATRCTIDSFLPSGVSSSLRNCFDLTLFESGQRRLPEPPDNNIICISVFRL